MRKVPKHYFHTRRTSSILRKNMPPQPWTPTPLPWSTTRYRIPGRELEPSSRRRPNTGEHWGSKHEVGDFRNQAWSFVCTHRGMKFCTLVWNYPPRYENLYAGMKPHTWVWNFTPGYEATHLGMKLHTWVWNFVPDFEITHPGVKFCAWIWNYTPGYDLLYLSMKPCDNPTTFEFTATTPAL
jgi:hypothetical protein